MKLEMTSFILVLALLMAGIIWVYMQMAFRFQILDKPNERSSHRKPTIRGGGIIFPIAWIIYSLINGFLFPWFTFGLVVIAIVSFFDDLKPIAARWRFITHLISLVLLFKELQLFDQLPVWMLVISLILSIGLINAINFMDGINGITGLYSISIFSVLLVNNAREATIADLHYSSEPLAFILASLLAFGFFNFRRKALCFAGDVGSVSLGFILLFFIMRLVYKYEDSNDSIPILNPVNEYRFKYVLFVAVYGVDSILTISHRLLLKENIFKAHRKHLYQYLSNEMKWPHLSVAFLYAALQFTICLYVILNDISLMDGIIICLTLSMIYFVSKRFILRRTEKTRIPI